jgi:hypothetical protein
MPDRLQVEISAFDQLARPIHAMQGNNADQVIFPIAEHE